MLFFLQLLTLHGTHTDENGVEFIQPLAYVLLSNKKKVTYKKVLRKLRQLSKVRIDGKLVITFKPQSWMVDYEIGKNVFIYIYIHICLSFCLFDQNPQFHYIKNPLIFEVRQNLWRHLILIPTGILIQLSSNFLIWTLSILFEFDKNSLVI